DYIAVPSENFASTRVWPRDGPTEDLSHGVEPILESRYHAEVATAAAPHCPEQVGRLLRRGDDRIRVSGHDLHAGEIVDGQPESPRQITPSAPQRVAGDTAHVAVAADRTETERRRLAVHVAPERAALHRGGLRRRVDDHSPHGREIDQQRVVTDGETRGAVAA